jgi:predicted Zn-ribbon and HTH transcriptional regulator
MRKSKEPFIPSERLETIRRGIVFTLKGQTLSAREISGIVKISEKEVYGHLEHIQRAARNTTHPLIVTPSECKKCGFIFRKRERLKRPGKCPICHGESITEPIFSMPSS